MDIKSLGTFELATRSQAFPVTDVRGPTLVCSRNMPIAEDENHIDRKSFSTNPPESGAEMVDEQVIVHVTTW